MLARHGHTPTDAQLGFIADIFVDMFNDQVGLTAMGMVYRYLQTMNRRVRKASKGLRRRLEAARQAGAEEERARQASRRDRRRRAERRGREREERMGLAETERQEGEVEASCS
jgi:hypothetical protein